MAATASTAGQAGTHSAAAAAAAAPAPAPAPEPTCWHVRRLAGSTTSSCLTKSLASSLTCIGRREAGRQQTVACVSRRAGQGEHTCAVPCAPPSWRHPSAPAAAGRPRGGYPAACWAGPPAHAAHPTSPAAQARSTHQAPAHHAPTSCQAGSAKLYCPACIAFSTLPSSALSNGGTPDSSSYNTTPAGDREEGVHACGAVGVVTQRLRLQHRTMAAPPGAFHPPLQLPTRGDHTDTQLLRELACLPTTCRKAGPHKCTSWGSSS